MVVVVVADALDSLPVLGVVLGFAFDTITTMNLVSSMLYSLIADSSVKILPKN